MNRVMLLLIVTALSFVAFAQQPASKASDKPTPAATPSPKADAELLKPIILDEAERSDAAQKLKTVSEQINQADQAAASAQAQLVAAQEAKKRLQVEFSLYVSQLALKKRVDPDKYEVSISAFDEQGQILGFKPKAPTPKDKVTEKK